MFEILWQDVVFSLGNILFFIALLPSVFSSNKPSIWTSLLTAPTLTAFAVTFYTLGLNLSMIGAGVGALTWWVLAIQKYLIDRKQTQI